MMGIERYFQGNCRVGTSRRLLLVNESFLQRCSCLCKNLECRARVDLTTYVDLDVGIVEDVANLPVDCHKRDNDGCRKSCICVPGVLWGVNREPI